MNQHRSFLLILAVVVPVWLGSQWLPSPPVSVVANDHDQTVVIRSDTAIVNLFKRECSSCHGVDGKGETRAGQRAGVKNFTDKAYQASWTDEEGLKVVKTATKDGKQLRNKKPFAEKLTDEQIRKLIQHVRSFSGK